MSVTGAPPSLSPFAAVRLGNTPTCALANAPHELSVRQQSGEDHRDRPRPKLDAESAELRLELAASEEHQLGVRLVAQTGRQTPRWRCRSPSSQ